MTPNRPLQILDAEEPLRFLHGNLDTLADYRRAGVAMNLFAAAQAGHVSVVSAALAKGVTDKAKLRAFSLAVAKGYSEVTEVILESGIDVPRLLLPELQATFGETFEAVPQAEMRDNLHELVARAERVLLHLAGADDEVLLTKRDLMMIGGLSEALTIAAKHRNLAAIESIEGLLHTPAAAPAMAI